MPNWIAPTVPAMFFLMVIYWNERLRADSRLVKPFLAAGLAVGFLMAAVMYDPDFLRTYESYAQTVEILPGTKKALDLKLTLNKE